MTYSYGNLLTIVRSAKNLSQEQLARQIGINKSLVSRYESGERKLAVEKFETFCLKVGLPRNLIKLLVATGVDPKNSDLAQELGMILLKEMARTFEQTNASK